MNKLSSQQRKLVYLGGIGLMVIPIIVLGGPATRDNTGGTLARLRDQHGLGEKTLGKVDPSSATMNLILLGLRGVATDLLWLQAIEQKKTKNWAHLRATVNSITLLQPHYIKVWDFQGWNLAFNVSAEWDAVEDRYYWVKEGAKFLRKGSQRNTEFSELYYWTGRILGHKIGRADEWRLFRRYFLNDPDPTSAAYPGGPDKELNPDGQDNYLVSREEYLIANQKEPVRGQHIEARILFRAKPAQSRLFYALVLQREGIFDEKGRQAWEDAYDEWTQVFGQEVFQSLRGVVRLDPTEDEILELAKERMAGQEDPSLEIALENVREDVIINQNMSNYRYWKRRSNAEKRGETEKAHRELFLAHQAFFQEGDVAKAQKLAETGLKIFEITYNKHFQKIKADEFAIEEVLRAVLLLRYCHKLQGTQMPEDFPLKHLWERWQSWVPEIDEEMRRQQQRVDN